MKRLRIRHITGFRYEGEVSASYNEARMLPATDGRQLVLDSRLEIRPVSSRHVYEDYWGTKVVAFDVLTAHRDLSLTATFLVEALEPSEIRGVVSSAAQAWPELSATVAHSSELLQYVRQTTLTDPPAPVAERAHEIVDEAGEPELVALEICRWIRLSMEYVTGVTGVQSTASEAWEKRRGVCQDIAHLAVGALRAAGIPARYVSGYLHPSQEPLVGETVVGESHAWVEWFSGSWHAYDPTNGIPVGDRHVSVGRGRDYNDVPPLRGVYAGQYGSELFVTVEVTREG